jgi:hypothetical protein
MPTQAIIRLLEAFRERWPLHELPDPELLQRALHRATSAEIDAVALVSVGLDDYPPSPAVLARRVALERAAHCRPVTSLAPRVPDPAVLELIGECRERMAAAGDRLRL